jgi:DNA replicative helicase MCM subunit Mcm2 (Cdc46/Mcm family)
VIRDLNPAHINKLIAVSGMVTRTSGVIPDQRWSLGHWGSVATCVHSL